MAAAMATSTGSSGKPSGRGKYINGHRRRTCICGEPECTLTSRLYCLADDGQLCAFVVLPIYSDKDTRRGRLVRAYRKRVFTKLGLMDKKDLSAKREFVSALHFHRALLQDRNLGAVDHIEQGTFGTLPDGVRSMLARKTDQIGEGPSKGHYFALPTMTTLDIANRLADDKKEWEAGISREDDGIGGRTDPTQRQLAIMIHQMKRDPTKMAVEFLRMENELIEIKLHLKNLKRGHDLEVASLQATVQSLRAELNQCVRLEVSGINRTTISSVEWHRKNPDMCRFLFGVMDDFGQLQTLLTQGFFPDVEVATGSGDDAVTQFEKILLCLVRMRRRFELKTLGALIGRHKSQVSRYMDEWLPELGRVGRYCSRLDMDKLHDYVSAEDAALLEVPHSSNQPAPKHRFFYQDALPLEFSVEEGMDFIAALKDGKDFMTDTTRTNSALTRQMWSDKIHNSGARCITWITPSGLVFEHTGLFLARTPEIRLVELWGKQL